MSKRTYIAFVLDRSGSMQQDVGITINGFNAQVDIVKENSALGGDTRVSLITFGGEPAENALISALTNLNKSTSSNNLPLGQGVLIGSPAPFLPSSRVVMPQAVVTKEFINMDTSRLVKISTETYRPDGGTPLYDAIGETIDELLKSEGANSEETAFLVAIFTDGAENASTKYTATQISTKIAELEKTGRWTFTLIGPKNGVESVGDLLKIDKGNRTGFDPSLAQSKSQAFQSLAGATSTYMNMRSNNIMEAKSLYASSDQPLK